MNLARVRLKLFICQIKLTSSNPPLIKRFLFLTNQNKNGSANGRKVNNKIGESSLILQEGLNIQELPVAVIKAKYSSNETNNISTTKTYVKLDPKEEKAFIEGFESYKTPLEVLKILDTIPSEEVNPNVALSILKKLIELENNFRYRNEGVSWFSLPSSSESANNNGMDTFARMAIMSRLIDTIISSDDLLTLVNAINVLKCEGPTADTAKEELFNYKQKICEEILLRVTMGEKDITTVCKAIISIGEMKLSSQDLKLQNDFLDKLWVGILLNKENINPENINLLFKTIQYFSKSQRVVMSLIEQKICEFWRHLNIEDVAEICNQLLKSYASPMLSDKINNPKELRRNSNSWSINFRMLAAISKCTCLNIHQINENQLMKIIRAFYALNYYDESFDKMLRKYMKAKCLKISDANLVAWICNYANKYRIRSEEILQGAAEFVLHKDAINLSPPQLVSILSTFGHLNYTPSNGFQFWENVENCLNKKFVEFPPDDLIDLFLGFVYLKKYPLNFVDKIFSPYFFDRLFSIKEGRGESDSTNSEIRKKLKLLDTSLTLECGPFYKGPLLPKDFSVKSHYHDGRIVKMAHILEETLTEMYKDTATIEKFVMLPNLPFNELYIIDVVLSRNSQIEQSRKFLNEDLRRRIGKYGIGRAGDEEIIVLLINIPEHFANDGITLIGPQALRLRHLESLGFRVISLNYLKLFEIRDKNKNNNEFSQYLRNIIKSF